MRHFGIKCHICRSRGYVDLPRRRIEDAGRQNLYCCVLRRGFFQSEGFVYRVWDDGRTRFFNNNIARRRSCNRREIVFFPRIRRYNFMRNRFRRRLLDRVGRVRRHRSGRC